MNSNINNMNNKNTFIGCDILKIDRIKEKINLNFNFLSIFSESELNYCNITKENADLKNKKLNLNNKDNIKYDSLAAIFSVKESLIKIFSKLESKNYSQKDFEILHENKIPYVKIKNTEIEKYEKILDISISHDNEMVFTTAVLSVKTNE